MKPVISILLTLYLVGAALAQSDGMLLERVVAWVDDEPIMLTELEEALVQYQSEGLIEAGEATEVKLQAALERMIDGKLILREARKQGIKIEPEALDNRVDALLKRMAEQVGGMEPFNAAISAKAITPAAFKERLREQVEREWLIARALSARVSVTQDEVDAFVEQRKAEGKPVERYAMAHAFLPVAKEAESDAWDAAEADLYMLLAKISRKGDFMEQAEEWAAAREDEGADAGPLGIVDPTEMQPALVKASKDLKEGQSTEPVRTDRGVHVLHLLRRTTPREILQAERYREARREWVESLRREASIQKAKTILQ